MSNTIRNIPPRFKNAGSFADDLKRGHISIPKQVWGFDEVWGNGKKSRRKELTRKARREGKLYRGD
jgi:hypothetical protein